MSMKIKIFGSKNVNELERTVNDFCEEHDIVDMRHTALIANGYVIDRIFVMYDDNDKSDTEKESKDYNCTNCKYMPVSICNEPCNTCSSSTFNHWEAGK